MVSMLVFVGLGYSTRHITPEALEELKTADVIYIDTYTSLYSEPLENLLSINPKAKYIFAKREHLEGKGIAEVLALAKREKVVIAVPGDPFIATTHDAILSEAMKLGVPFKIINGLSILTLAYSRTGLQAYRFGKIVTLTYPDGFKPYSTLEFIYDNLLRGLHTLVLLDLRVDESKAMSIPEAVDILRELDYKGMLENSLAYGLARLGWSDEKICFNYLYKLGNYKYPPPPHSIVVVARLDPVEEEIASYWMRNC